MFKSCNTDLYTMTQLLHTYMIAFRCVCSILLVVVVGLSLLSFLLGPALGLKLLYRVHVVLFCFGLPGSALTGGVCSKMY